MKHQEKASLYNSYNMNPTFMSWARAASSSIVGREGLGSPPSPVNSCSFFLCQKTRSCFAPAPGLPSSQPSGHPAPWWARPGCGPSWSRSWWPPPGSTATAGPSDQDRFPPPKVQFVKIRYCWGVSWHICGGHNCHITTNLENLKTLTRKSENLLDH